MHVSKISPTKLPKNFIANPRRSQPSRSSSPIAPSDPKTHPQHGPPSPRRLKSEGPVTHLVAGCWLLGDLKPQKNIKKHQKTSHDHQNPTQVLLPKGAKTSFSERGHRSQPSSLKMCVCVCRTWTAPKRTAHEDRHHELALRMNQRLYVQVPQSKHCTAKPWSKWHVKHWKLESNLSQASEWWWQSTGNLNNPNLKRAQYVLTLGSSGILRLSAAAIEVSLTSQDAINIKKHSSGTTLTSDLCTNSEVKTSCYV